MIFGVHTCDIHAMKLLDAVFATGQPDEHYLRRRESTLIIGIECLKPCDEHSFCKSMNTLTANDGFDLHLTDLGDVYAVEVGTEAGEKLLQEHCQVCDASETAVAQLNQVLSEKWPNFSFRLDFDGAELPALMALSYKDPLWDGWASAAWRAGRAPTFARPASASMSSDKWMLNSRTANGCALWDRANYANLRRWPVGITSVRPKPRACAIASCARANTSSKYTV